MVEDLHQIMELDQNYEKSHTDKLTGKMAG